MMKSCIDCTTAEGVCLFFLGTWLFGQVHLVLELLLLDGIAWR
jgi:hypothetical protein